MELTWITDTIFEFVVLIKNNKHITSLSHQGKPKSIFNQNRIFKDGIEIRKNK